MEPMTTAVVDLTKPTRLNSFVPMMTFARPMTMVPGTHTDFKEAFLLTVDGPGQRGQAVGDGQTHDFYHPFVFGKRGNQRVVVADRPEQVADRVFK